MNQCSSCSTDIRADMKFCPSCGLNLNEKLPNLEEESLSGPSADDPVERLGESLAGELSPSVSSKLDSSSGMSKSGKVVLVVTGVVVLAALVSFLGVTSANENAERETQAKRAELVAEACGNLVQNHLPVVRDTEVRLHSEAIERVDVRFLDANGSPIGEVADCDYSVSGTTVYLERIEWSADIEGAPTDILWNRSTNIISIEKERVAPVEVQTSSGCEDAFRRAASVPLSQDNNDEIAETTRACSDVDEWWSMLKRYPDVFGVTSFLESERGLYVGSACLVGQGSPVCQDADRRGIGF